MPLVDLSSELLHIAHEFLDQGPGFAQESVVLREAVERLGIEDDLERQQDLLTSWHDLFRKGELSWGYDVDNPSAPFFHRVKR